MTRDESLKILNSVYEDIKNMTEEDIENFNNTVREYDEEQKMTDREVKEHLIFNPETGISEDGTMHDCVYRPRINQLKIEDSCKFGKDYIKIVFKNGSTLDTLVMEEKMTREEAINILKKKMYEDADKITFEHLDGSQYMRTINIDLEMKEAIEVLEREEQKVIDILDWKDGDVYKWRNMKYKLVKGVLYVSNSGKSWKPSAYNDLNNDGKMVKIIKTETVKVKSTAYHVKDQYSFNKLMEELEGCGYTWISSDKLTEQCEQKFSHFIFIRDGKKVTRNIYLKDLCDFNKKYGDEYDLIEYYKEEPKLKAWKTEDRYSFNELKKELKHKFYYASEYDNYIYEIKDIDGSIDYGWTISLELIEDIHEIIEYKKEPPKFYAKIKGWELTNDGDCYWYKDENPIHGIYPWSEEEASIYTKEEWAKLGITDENADFEVIK